MTAAATGAVRIAPPRARRSGDSPALVATGMLLVTSVITQDLLPAVTANIAAALTPAIAVWARRRPQHTTQAWKISAIAVVFCAAWLAITVARYFASVGPCNESSCALGAPVLLVVAAMYAMPLMLTTYQLRCLVRSREGK